MNTERANTNKEVGLIIDSLFMILAFFVVYYLRQPFKDAPFHKLAPIGDYFWLLAVSLPFSWIALLLLGAYSTKPKVKRQFIDLFGRVCLAMLFVLSLIFFVFSVQEVNRTFVIPFVLLSAFFFASWRVLLLKWQRARGISRKALLVGDGERFPAIVEQLQTDPLRGFHVIGCVTDESAPGTEFGGLPVLGNLQDLYRVLHKEVVDEVIFGIDISEMEQYRTLLKICETVGVNVLILIDYQWPRFSRVETGKLLNRPFLYFASNPVDDAGSWAKAVLDRAVGLIALALAMPFMIVIGLLVKLSSPGPVLFVQERTGLNGRKFKMYKFRTMITDAEQMKAELQQLNQMSGPVFKMKNDPRITRLGLLLRKYSLDELPQLFNVLKGDMSLVGPRPLPCEEASMIHGMQRRRFSVKPGLTCIWQISGRNQLSYDQWMDLDLQYVDKWSLGLDFKILLKTPGAIFSSKGAF
jgi:exopolysaccharide biosynthesis polyprenyl glycosylphosphotransferase